MKLVDLEPITEKRGIALIVSETEPSAEVSGADVDEMANDYVLAAGSVIITPSANYIAFTDGTFTAKE